MEAVLETFQYTATVLSGCLLRAAAAAAGGGGGGDEDDDG